MHFLRLCAETIKDLFISVRPPERSWIEEAPRSYRRDCLKGATSFIKDIFSELLIGKNNKETSNILLESFDMDCNILSFGDISDVLRGFIG